MKNILIQGEPKSGISTLLKVLIDTESDKLKVVFDTHGDLVDRASLDSDQLYCVRTLFGNDDKAKLESVLNTSTKDIIVIIDHAEFFSSEKLKYIREVIKDLEVNVSFVVAHCTGVHTTKVDNITTSELRRTFSIDHEFVSLQVNSEYKLYKSKNFGESYKLVTDKVW